MANVLVTGCSSGFGYLTAQALAARAHFAFPTSGILEKRELGADRARTDAYGALGNGIYQMDKGLEQLFSAPEPPRAHEVADAIVALVEAPAGQRPGRVVIDRFGSDGARQLNDAHAEVQKTLLSAWGLGFLAD